MENKSSPIKQFFLLCGGFDFETVREATSNEMNRLALMGSMVLIPTLIGTFSFGYAGYYISTQNVFAGILAGLIWGIIIFLFDRSIVGSTSNKFGIGMIGRLLLAVIIGLTVSEPLTILCFGDAVKAEQQSELTDQKESVVEKYQSQIALLKDELDLARQRVDEKQLAYTSEMDGTGGSMIRNQGPIYKRKFQDYIKEEELFNATKNKAEKEITALNYALENELINLEKNNVEQQGLLNSLRSLHKIKDSIVHYTTWLLRLFFFFIELLPILIKISYSKNEDTNLYTQMQVIKNNEKAKAYAITSQGRREVYIHTEHIKQTMEKIEYEMEKYKFLLRQVSRGAEMKYQVMLELKNKVDDKSAHKLLLDNIDSIYEGFLSSLNNKLHEPSEVN